MNFAELESEKIKRLLKDPVSAEQLKAITDLAMKPKRLKRYSMVNTTTSHAFMREDPAGDWVAWSEAANTKLTHD